jgi:hypothetical protein
MDTFRQHLLGLIMAAPDPCGFDKSLPHYMPQWNAARKLLRDTCPAHDASSGTCPNCHGDAEGDSAGR